MVMKDAIPTLSSPVFTEMEKSLYKELHIYPTVIFRNGMVLNPEKTQLLLVGGRTVDREQFSMVVDSVEIRPAAQLDLLGVCIDSKLSLLPQAVAAAAAAKARATVVRRLSAHLPPGQYLRTLANGLLMGKVGYAAAAAYKPRLSPDQPQSGPLREVQTAINKAARAVCGVRRDAHIPVEELLRKAGLPSINRMTVYMVALEAWKAAFSHDGPQGSRNPLGELLFSAPRHHPRAAGLLNPPLRFAADTFVYEAYTIWNQSKNLREASTLSAAKRAAHTVAAAAPL